MVEAAGKSLAEEAATSPWSPFRHTTFSVLWTATVVSNIGSWMYSAASGWLMTSLNPDPFIVSMVQVATTLPIFLFALPAGALADIVDRRKFLLVAEIIVTALSAIYAGIVSSRSRESGRTRPRLLRNAKETEQQALLRLIGAIQRMSQS